MQISAEHVFSDCAVFCPVVQTAEGRTRPAGVSHVDLIALQGCPGKGRRSAHRSSAGPGLFPGEDGLAGEEAEPFKLSLPLDAFRIGQAPAEHLVTAADAQNRRPRLMQAEHFIRKAAFPQPLQVSGCVLGSRENHKVRRSERVPPFCIPHADGRVLLQGREIRKV